MVGGTLRSTPREAVLAEAGMQEVRKAAEGMWVAELARCKEAQEGDPRREWGLMGVRRRLTRADWRSRAEELWEELWPGGVRSEEKVLGGEPWGEPLRVSWDLLGVKGEDKEENRRE